MSVRIGQMTDIHVRDFSGMRLSDWFGKRMTGWVNYQSKRAKEYSAEVVAAGVARLVEERPDLVVVSGDLTNVGLETELVAALRLLAPLREAGVRTVVFPGNHDMYVTAATRGGFERVAADWQIADARGERPYPFVVRAGEVSCVCFNSAIPVPPVLAYGRLGRQQLDDAARLCAAERSLGQTLVFAVHHHATRAPERPAEWMRNLRDVAAFRRLAAEYGAVLVLHGHNHYEHTRRLREAPGVVVSGISSSTTTRTDPPPRRGQIGMYELDGAALLGVGVADWDGARFGQWRWTTPSDIPVESEHESLAGG